jgi:chromosomal replication initiator protein
VKFIIPEATKIPSPDELEKRAATPAEKQAIKERDVLADSMHVSPDHSFDNFIVGSNNQLAYAAAVAVANQPGTAYNPLFIHGGVGLGKTHLLQAICQSIMDANPLTRVLYVSCEVFMNQFIACVQSGEMDSFHNRYRDVDLLVIDDIHFLAQRERSQEEFFHTFNALYQSNRQIVLSSDAAPDQIPDLEERLVSRFQWGLVSPVTKPSYETRVAILNAKLALHNMDVPAEVVRFVARRIDSNARELEGAVKTLLGQSLLLDRPIDLMLVHQLYGENEPAPLNNHITLQNITDLVTQYYNVKLSDLQSRRRHKSITGPRQVCMWLARRNTRFSLEEIGGFFGGRDHTTVMHSTRIVDQRRGENAAYLAETDLLDERLSQLSNAE